MIVFDLACARGHVFEGWFGTSEEYADQRARGLLACPICGDDAVGKAVMAPNVGAKANSMPVKRAERAPSAADPAQAPEQVKAMLRALAETQRRMIAQSEHVGTRFADEARAIHLGESDARSIHGQATRAEAEALADEGIAVMPLPFPLIPPHTEN